MKRPAFQFYPADWRKDTALQSCSLAARGLWHEMLCLMHECEPYGHMAVNGKPMKAAQIARLVGVTDREYKKLLCELEDAGVYSTTEDGCIYSRRMVKDERIRNVRAEAGKKGGNPNLLGAKDNDLIKQKDNQTDKQTGKQSSTPSSSSSSSTTVIKEKTNKKENSGTDEPANTSVVSSTSPGHESDKPPSPVSPHGAIATYVRSQGIHAVSTDLELQNLVKAGATMAHFVDAVPICRENHKGWKYLLGIVKNMLQDAHAPPRIALRRQTSSTHDSWDRINQNLRNQQESDHVIDGEVTVVDDKQSHG
jgi:hypothetical protein